MLQVFKVLVSDFDDSNVNLSRVKFAMSHTHKLNPSAKKSARGVRLAKGKSKQDMKRFWERLSKREKVLVIASFTILPLVLGRYFLIVPYLQHEEWVSFVLSV
jgi:hypothetical protein